jgi:hypothetical protein
MANDDLEKKRKEKERLIVYIWANNQWIDTNMKYKFLFCDCCKNAQYFLPDLKLKYYNRLWTNYDETALHFASRHWPMCI